MTKADCALAYWNTYNKHCAVNLRVQVTYTDNSVECCETRTISRHKGNTYYLNRIVAYDAKKTVDA